MVNLGSYFWHQCFAKPPLRSLAVSFLFRRLDAEINRVNIQTITNPQNLQQSFATDNRIQQRRITELPLLATTNAFVMQSNLDSIDIRLSRSRCDVAE